MQLIHPGSMAGPGGSRPPGIDPHQQIPKGTRGPSDRQTDRCDFQGPCQEREEGLFSCSAPDQLRLLQSAAAGRHVNGCLPHCLCESQKNKHSNFRLLETNFYGAHTKSSTPFRSSIPQVWKLGRARPRKWLHGHRPHSLGRHPQLRQMGPHHHIALASSHQQGSQSKGQQRGRGFVFKHKAVKCALSLLTWLYLKPCAGGA